MNYLLAAGWRLLHIYTLRYEGNGVCRERPMAILGRLRNAGRERATRLDPIKSPQDASVSFPLQCKSLGGATHRRK